MDKRTRDSLSYTVGLCCALVLFTRSLSLSFFLTHTRTLMTGYEGSQPQDEALPRGEASNLQVMPNAWWPFKNLRGVKVRHVTPVFRSMATKQKRLTATFERARPLGEKNVTLFFLLYRTFIKNVCFISIGNDPQRSRQRCAFFTGRPTRPLHICRHRTGSRPALFGTGIKKGKEKRNKGSVRKAAAVPRNASIPCPV